MIELLAPAGSPEGVRAAVQNGADAIYLGFGGFNARRNAKNFTETDFAQAAEYCRMRGVKVYVTLNTLVTDREKDRIAVLGRQAWTMGADAVLVQDLGVARILRQVCPDMPLHASTQMSLHTLEGVKLAADMGLQRVVLSRELRREDIAAIAAESPVELEIFVHGALCMCHSGQCFMSSVIGRRSGNRGLCAQPCRMAYTHDGTGTEYPLSMKDNCLVRYVGELEKMGIASLKIEGRMRRPEYAAIVTGIYSRAIREHTAPTAQEMETLRQAFSREGFTDGYYTDRLGPEMFGVRKEEEKHVTSLYTNARKGYLNGEFQRVPVRFAAKVEADTPIRLVALDGDNHAAAVEGAVPEDAFHRPLTETTLQTQLYKTGGTPFYCTEVRSQVAPGLSLSMSDVNDLRRRALAELLEQRRQLPERRVAGHSPVPEVAGPETPPVLTVQVQRTSQLSPELAARRPAVVYYPLEETLTGRAALEPFLRTPETEVCAVLPRVFRDAEWPQLRKLLEQARRIGVSSALCGNLGQLRPVKACGFEVRGDFGLNVFNSDTMAVLRELRLKSVTASFELRLEAIRDLSKALPTEAILYGRLPLMITENCIVKNCKGMCGCEHFAGISDRTGATFPVLKAWGCRNLLLNSKKLFLADRPEHWMHLGLWGGRLYCTTENAAECVAIYDTYTGRSWTPPAEITRGLYYRGVE